MRPFKTLLATAAATGALLLTPAAHAQQELPAPVAEAQVPAEAAEMAGPALWQVSDEDTTIYLFGTIHALPQDVDWYSGPIENALSASDTLVTEIPAGAGASTEMQQIIAASGMLPEGTTLRSLLDEEQAAVYEEALAKLGMPPEGLDRFKPWMAGLTLTMVPLLQQGYSPDAGVENRLEELAGHDLQREALETMEFQIAIFDSLPQEAQIDFLVASAAMIDEIKPMLDAMVAEWLAGNPDALARLMNEELDDPALAKALLYDRNANWAQWIDDRMEQPGTVFIAVGAGHLAGEQSVQDMLDERGIESVRVQ